MPLDIEDKVKCIIYSEGSKKITCSKRNLQPYISIENPTYCLTRFNNFNKNTP